MADTSGQMQCMEVWGASEAATRAVEMGGLNAWVYSKPYGEAHDGGDVYYASSCATGRINRLLLADVAGHGSAVSEMAMALRKLMRRYVNFLDQKRFVQEMNRSFSALASHGQFATALVTTFFTPTRRLSICNAGHPRPMWYRKSLNQWFVLENPDRDGEVAAQNIPLGIIDLADYQQFDIELDVGDLVLCYTDALSESRCDGKDLLGEAGLLSILANLDASRPQELIDRLLAQIEQRAPGGLAKDDVTVLLLRATGDRPRVSVGQKFGAAMRMTAALGRAVNPRAERPPLPDWNLANLGGALIPKLGRRWRCPPRSGSVTPKNP